jgi:hypothetical protein
VLISVLVSKLSDGKGSQWSIEMTKTRKRNKQVTSLQERLATFAQGVRSKAALLPPGPDQDEMLSKLHSAETAAHIEDWANSPSLQPPT